jgi:tetratricopeptide (TPR) repeat protein
MKPAMLNGINISVSKQKLIIYIILTIVTLAVYWQVNQYGFVNFDDYVYVIENDHIQSGITPDGFRWAFSTTYAEFWHPLTWLSLMFDYQLHGGNPGGYHTTNLILHILSTLLLFWLFNRMTKALWRSAFIAALFALHPLHVESVAWIAERKDVLSAFFWMLTLCLYVYYTEKPIIRRYLLVVFCFVLALMSKPMVVTLPFILLLLDYWPLNRLESRKTAATEAFTEASKNPEIIPAASNKEKKNNKVKQETLKKNISSPHAQKLPETKIAGIIPVWQLWEKLPFFILSAVFSIITIYSRYKPALNGIPLSSRLANAPVAFVSYLEKTFWPYDMTVFYPYPDQLPLWQVLGTTLLIIAISAAVILMVKRLSCLLAGWLWFAITLLPVIGIIPVGEFAMADRYHYLPSIGLAIMVAWGIPSLIKPEVMRRKILFPAGIIALIIMAILTWQQCTYWQDSSELWNHALRVTKNNYMAQSCLGKLLYKKGKIRESFYHFNEAVRMKPDYCVAYNDRGSVFSNMGQYQRAFEDFNEAIRLQPDYAEPYFNRGVIYDKLGQYQRAMQDDNEATRLKPDYADAYYNRGIVYEKLEQHQPAIEDFSKAIALKENYADAYYNRGVVYNKLGQYQMAIEDFSKAVTLEEDYADAFYDRGVAYTNLGQYQRAIEDFNRVIRINPAYFKAYNNMAGVYLQYGGNKELGCYYAQKACAQGLCRALTWAKGSGLCR